MKNQITFCITGVDPNSRVKALEKAYEKWKTNPQPYVSECENPGKKLFIIITEPSRDTSVEHCISTAISDIKDGITEAGGSIWDGSHVWITRSPVIHDDEI